MLDKRTSPGLESDYLIECPRTLLFDNSFFDQTCVDTTCLDQTVVDQLCFRIAAVLPIVAAVALAVALAVRTPAEGVAWGGERDWERD